MALVCYHASQEQFSPSALLSLVKKAEEVGFEGIHSSDHFHPWSKRQGESGFTFSWIGAAMQATFLPFSMVCAPGQRYHPAIIAQAIATLGEMFPARFNIELGSGEALNESITGETWPSKEIRDQRLFESAQVIRQLLAGEEVNFDGHVKVKNARLYTLPKFIPKLLCAALTNETSEWAGTWADGLLTTSGKVQDVEAKMKKFSLNGGDNKPVYLQFAFSYARNLKKAQEGAFEQWRSNILPTEKFAQLRTVEEFDRAGNDTTMEQVLEVIPAFSDMNEIAEEIRKLRSTGAARIILHNINIFHDEFLEDARSLFTSR